MILLKKRILKGGIDDDFQSPVFSFQSSVFSLQVVIGVLQTRNCTLKTGNWKLFTLAFLFSTALFGQRPGIPNTGQPTGVATPDSTLFSGRQDDAEVDTFGIYSFYAERPWEVTEVSDTLLDNFPQMDPVRNTNLELANLGNMGSAHHFLIYTPRFREGFDIGLHQYDLYQTTGRSLPYYLIKTPFTIVNYTRGSEQADSYFSAKFARNFTNGVHLTLDYKRLSQLGEGQYLNQNNRNTAIALGLWYHNRSKKYNAFFSYAANTIEQEDNGGIFNEPEQQDTTLGFLINYQPTEGDIALPDAKTRYAHRELSFTHYYQLSGKEDSTRQKRRTFSIGHEAIYKSSTYKFGDVYSAGDSTFYKWFPDFRTDERGMRFFIEHQKIQNSFRILTYKKAGKPQKGGKAKNKDYFELGISHTWHKVKEEGAAADTILNDIFLKGKLHFEPKEGLWLKTYAHLGLGNNAGDYRISGELFLDLGKAGELRLNASNQLYRPDLLQYRFYLTQRELWNNDFKKTLETNFEAEYLIPFVKIRAKAAYHLLNNYIYFDTLGVPKQTGVPVSISQLILAKNIKVGHFHLDNTMAFQQSSESFLRLPAIYGKHSLYYSGQWFKKHLNIRIGVDLRYTDTYNGYYYNPATGRFQLEDRKEVASFPSVDAWLSFRITKFRGFFKYENLANLFTGDELYYTTAYYPYPRPFLRFGFSWKLLN